MTDIEAAAQCPPLITTAQARQWFVQHIHNTEPVPTEEQLIPLVDRMNLDIDFNWRTKNAWRGKGESLLPNVREFRGMAYTMRETLNEFAGLGAGFWPTVGVKDSTIAQLREALAELGDFAQAPSKTGRNSEGWHAFALTYG